MAIGRISGSVLKSNLTRNGTDLAFETNLLYLDVTNSRVGIGTSEPTTTLHVNGTTNTTALQIGGTAVTATAAELNVLDGTTLGSANELCVVDATGNFITTTSTLSIDQGNNYVGINQSSPEVTLHMTGDGAQTAQIRMEQYNDTADAPDIRTRKGRGTEASPSDTSAGDYLFRQNVESRQSGSWVTMHSQQFDTDGSDATKGVYQLQTHDGTSLATRMGIDNSGKVYIGANAYTLPTTDGSANQVLQTNGSGTLSFSDLSVGDLSIVGSTISSPSDADLTLTTAGTGSVVIGSTIAANGSGNSITVADTLRIAQSGSGLRMTNVGAFDNDGSDNFRIFSTNDLILSSNGDSNTALTIDGTTQDVTINQDLGVTGTVTATAFAGDGSQLTGINVDTNIQLVGDDSTGATLGTGETFKIAGGTNITTAVSGDTLTVTGSKNINVNSISSDDSSAIQINDAINVSGDINTAGTVVMDRLALSSSQTTVPPLQLTASSLNDGVGALRIDSVEPDIFLNDTDGGFATVTFGAPGDGGFGRVAFGRDNGNDFYLTVRDPSTNGGNWRNDTLVADSSTGNLSLGYDLSVGGSIALTVGSDPTTVADKAHIYAKDEASSAEVFVRDEAGNVTKISPHNEQGEWEYYSRNVKTGKTVRINMEEMIRDIEKLTGKIYIKND